MDPKSAEAAVANLASKGYVHPEKNVYNGNSPYMTYNEKGSDVYSSFSRRDMYGNMNSYEVDVKEEKKRENEKPVPKCPVCGEMARYECECNYHDVMCSNRHIWYVLNNGVVITENPHAR